MFSNQFLRAEDEKAQMGKKSINWSFQYLLELLKSPELPGVLLGPLRGEKHKSAPTLKIPANGRSRKFHHQVSAGMSGVGEHV